MRYKTLTRLLVKLMGIYFLLTGLVSLVSSVIYLLMSLTKYGNYGGISIFAYPVAWGVASLVSVGLGFLLILASDWVVNRLIPSNRPYCPNCGYELTGNQYQQCPECGVNLQGMGLTEGDSGSPA